MIYDVQYHRILMIFRLTTYVFARLWFFFFWKNQIHHGGDEQMKKCQLCKRKINESFGIYCGRCDKIIGDVNADLAAEFASEQAA